MLRKITEAGFTLAELARIMNMPEKELSDLVEMIETKKIFEKMKRLSDAIALCPCYFINSCSIKGCHQAKRLQDRVIYLQNTLLHLLNGSVDAENAHPN